MPPMRNLCAAAMAKVRIMPRMTTPEATAMRTLALELPEADWRALRALEPDAVAWLRSVIQRRLGAAEDPPETDQFDEY